MAEAGKKIKYGGKKFKKLLSELYDEANELSMDYNCKVGIFFAPKETDQKSALYAYGTPSLKAFVEEMEARVKEEEEEEEEEEKKKEKLAKKSRKRPSSEC